MLKCFTDLFRRTERMKQAKITVLDSGFAVEYGEEVIRVDFEKIFKIIAFKRDLLTTDIVCFAIEVREQDTSNIIEINEEIAGFDTLDERLSQIPGFMSNWREFVIKPPFARQETVIFEKEQRG
ncbi:MAG: hypothetical protein NT010_00985 [Proteobacteria bacterium]|nr:hypothetical protein [Pseudomonadota bacterium]